MTINGDVKNDVFWTFNMVLEFASYVSFFFLPPASVCMWGVGGDMMEIMGRVKYQLNLYYKGSNSIIYANIFKALDYKWD